MTKSKAIDNFIQVLDSNFFKTLSEPVRVELLKFLLKNGCCDIATIAKSHKKDRSVLSRHLHMMADAGLLKSSKVVRNVYFEVDHLGLTEKIRQIFINVNRAMETCCPPNPQTKDKS